jgi:hypothetical protein
MNEYNKILQSFELQDHLNKQIWIKKDDSDQEKMNPKVRKKLMKIAYQFSDYLYDDLIVSDVIMTGSLSNFNWNEYSDIDLHLIIDFQQFPKDQIEIFQKLFKLKKSYFNLIHDIKIFDYEVELYGQDIEITHFSTGVYSVLKDKWLDYPKKEKFNIDKEILLSKAKSWMEKIDDVIESTNNEKDFDRAKKTLDDFEEKLKKYRTGGLEDKGEYSYENLVFKYLRRNGYLEKFFNHYGNLQDKILSLR